MDRERAESNTAYRQTMDRRRFTWRTVLYGFLLSRRRRSRRAEDDAPIYADVMHPWVFALAVGTMILSALDAYLTLQLLDRGASELNAAMSALLEHGSARFAAVKAALTAVGVLALVYVARALLFDRMRAGFLLGVVFGCYACLVCYEFVSLLRLT